MKKALVALMVVAMALVAQANVWNVDWVIMGALAPDDAAGDRSVSLFENYDITWELINATAGDTQIAQTSFVNGFITWDDTENEGGIVAKYGDWLLPKTSYTYLGYTTESTAQSIYQKITLVSKETGDEYVWSSDPVSVTPKAEVMDVGTDLGRNYILAGEGVTPSRMPANAILASWTKTTTIPEPATMSLLGLGALAMVLRRRIRR